MLTPLDIESKEFKRAPLGYSMNEVDRFLDEVILQYEKLYRENIDLKDKMVVLNERIQNYKAMEQTLKNTLLLAEKTSEELKNSAYQKSEHIIKEAELKSYELIQQAQDEVLVVEQHIGQLKKQYESTKIQFKHFLQTQLDLLNQDNTFKINLLDENIKATHSQKES